MNKSVLKNTAMLYLLTAAKMVLPLIVLPYLTRVLSVSAFGTVSYVKAVMQYMQMIIDFGFIVSGTKDIALDVDDKEKIRCDINSIMTARILLSIVSLILLFVISIFIPILRNNLLFVMLSYGAVFLSIFLFDFYFRGIEKMEIITIRFIIMKSISTIFTFILVKDDSDLLFIPVLDILGTIVAIVLISIQLNKRGLGFSLSDLKSAFTKLRESSIYFASNIATTAFNVFNTVVIGIFLTPNDIGNWSVCMQLIGAVQSLYTPLSNGIYPQMVKQKRLKLVLRVFFTILPFIIIGCIFTYYLSDQLLYIIAGEKYIEGARLLQYLIPVLLFSFPVFLFGWPALGAIGRQKENTFATFIAAGFQILCVLMLVVLNHFTLLNISIVRNITELILMLSVLFYVYKYRNEFNYNM